MYRLPWDRPELESWVIVGMNHYVQDGKKCLFVSMVRNNICIKAEGEDEYKVFEELIRQAVAFDVLRGLKIKKYIEAMKIMFSYIKNCEPEAPDHVCGTPDACCDLMCSDYAEWCEDLQKVKTLMKEVGCDVS